MDTRTLNLRGPDFIQAINSLALSEKPDTATLRAVYTRQKDGPWSLLIARCVAGVQEEGLPDHIYPEYAFLTRTIDSFEVAAFVEQLCGDGYSLSEEYPAIRIIHDGPSWQEEIVPSHVTRNGLPARRYCTTIERDARLTGGQLFGYDLPYHADASEKIAAFIGIEKFHGQSDGRKGELSIEISDLRGAIVLGEDQLAISTDLTDLQLTGQINEEPPLCMNPGDVLSVRRSEVRMIEVWLLNKESEIIDYRSSTHWPHQFEAMEQEARQSERLIELIDSGESEICEFKTFIDLDDRIKRRDLEKTVCALSNHLGGTLLIGVDDEGEVQGLDRGLRSKTSWPEDEALDRYERAVKKHLREHLRDTQCFEISKASVRGERILYVRVTRSASINNTLNPAQTYVRRGGTNRQMEAAEILAHHNSDRFLQQL